MKNDNCRNGCWQNIKTEDNINFKCLDCGRKWNQKESEEIKALIAERK